MVWTYYRDLNSKQTSEIYTTKEGKSFTFIHDDGGRRLNMDSSIYFKKDEDWQAAIDRGLGTHATSLVTRARAHLGSYIALIEDQYGSIEGAPSAQKAKCRAIGEAQKELKALYDTEQKVDPADMKDGPLQEQRFKHQVQSILIKLRATLFTCDLESGSAMLGRADHLVVYAMDQVAKFNWPFAEDLPDTIEKNTRRRKITSRDELQLGAEGGLYVPKHEFPDGLSDISRDILVNALIQQDPDLKANKDDFIKGVRELGRTRGPLTYVFLRFYQWIQTLGSKNKERAVTPEQLSETRNDIIVSDVHAQRIAGSIPVNSSIDAAIQKIEAATSSLETNRKNTQKRALWHYLKQKKVDVNAISTAEQQLIRTTLQPLYQLSDLNHPVVPAILPDSTQGHLFARGGLFGSTYHLVDPMIAVIENMGKNDPVMGSIALMLWAAGGVYVGGIAAAKGAHMIGGEVFKALSAAIDKVPYIREMSQSVYTGVMPLSAQAGAGHVALAQMIDGFVLGHLAYQAMTFKTVFDRDQHSINGKIAHLVMTNPVEAAIMGAACFGLGLGTLHAMGDVNDMGTWTIFDDTTAAVKPAVFMADIFLAMSSAVRTHNPTFLKHSSEKISTFIVNQFVDSDCFSEKEKESLRSAFTAALKQASVGGEYAALQGVISKSKESWKNGALQALKKFLPGQAIREASELSAFMMEAKFTSEEQEAFKLKLENTVAGFEYEALSDFRGGLPPDKQKVIADLLELYFSKQINRDKEKKERLTNEIHSITADAFQKSLFKDFFDSEDKKVFSKLLSFASVTEPNKTLNGENSNLDEFLQSRYPDCVAAYGHCSSEGDKAQWERGLITALQKRYLDDLLIARVTNPRVWTVLKQYPELISKLSGASIEEIARIPVVPEAPSSWRATLAPSILRAVHGLLGIIVGLPMLASSYFFGTNFDESLRQWSGFNNLLGLIEGLPYLLGILPRSLSTINEMLILARARSYDSFLGAGPANIRRRALAFPGYALSAIVDIVISPFSVLYNLVAKGVSWVKGDSPSKPSWRDILYKIPLGFIAESLNEKSFQERAARRIIERDNDKHNYLGKIRSATTGRAGDISLYRQSHVEVKLEEPPKHVSMTINTTHLNDVIERYKQSKGFGSRNSHIMRRSEAFLQSITKNNAETIELVQFLRFVFPEEARKLDKQYNLEHVRQMHSETESAFRAERDQAVCYTLKHLFDAELAASKGSKTEAAFQAIPNRVGIVEVTTPKTSTSCILRALSNGPVTGECNDAPEVHTPTTILPASDHASPATVSNSNFDVVSEPDDNEDKDNQSLSSAPGQH